MHNLRSAAAFSFGSEAWDSAYTSGEQTNWERLPLEDLLRFWQQSDIFSEFESIIEIGCGRGLRSFPLLLGAARLNVPEVRYVGVDISKSAIAQARKLDRRLRHKSPPKLGAKIKNMGVTPGLVGHDPLLTSTMFEVADGTSFLTAYRQEFTTLIDWMCFHEMPPANRPAYIKAIKESAAEQLLLKVFSSENSSLLGLSEAVPGVAKYQFSQQQIAEFFAPEFEIVFHVQDEEDLGNASGHTDGAVAAKRAYFLKRRRF